MKASYQYSHANIEFSVIADAPSYVELDTNEQFVYFKDETVHSDVGICGILSYPKTLKFYSDLKERIRNEEKYSLMNHKLCLLLHGMSSHKNAIYQPLLAAKLSDMGYFVLRIDFRNNGDSELVQGHRDGRTIQRDVEDIEVVYKFVENSKYFLNHSLSLDAIIAHSRGVLSMFEFVRQHPNYNVPNLINCSARFDGNTLLDSLKQKNPSLEYDQQYTTTIIKNGEVKETSIELQEMQTFIELDCSKFKDINNNSWILSCYGSKENVVPLESAAQFAKIFESRHTLEIIEYANHNYLGMPDDRNLLNLPIRKGKVNYASILVQKITAHLKWEIQLKRFYKMTEYIESQNENIPSTIIPRWPLNYSFSNVSNFRDIGGYKSCFSNRTVKHGLIYRCANPCDITSKALEHMSQNLKVSRIFDLRSVTEAEENGIIEISNIPNLAFTELSFNNNQSMSPEVMAEIYQSLLISSHSFPKAYMKVLKSSYVPIKTFFQYILDRKCNEQNAIVYHCTAGKDRTGILTMLILLILGVDEDTVAKEYELTTIGLKTEKKLYDKIEARKDLYEQMTSYGNTNIIQEFNLTTDKMVSNLLSSRYEAMRIFIEQFNHEFGSIEEFFLSQLNFQIHDIGCIRDLLLN